MYHVLFLKSLKYKSSRDQFFEMSRALKESEFGQELLGPSTLLLGEVGEGAGFRVCAAPVAWKSPESLCHGVGGPGQVSPWQCGPLEYLAWASWALWVLSRLWASTHRRPVAVYPHPAVTFLPAWHCPPPWSPWRGGECREDAAWWPLESWAGSWGLCLSPEHTVGTRWTWPPLASLNRAPLSAGRVMCPPILRAGWVGQDGTEQGQQPSWRERMAGILPHLRLAQSPAGVFPLGGPALLVCDSVNCMDPCTLSRLCHLICPSVTFHQGTSQLCSLEGRTLSACSAR